jgi:hypothetical protein
MCALPACFLLFNLKGLEGRGGANDAEIIEQADCRILLLLPLLLLSTLSTDTPQKHPPSPAPTHSRLGTI